MLLCLHICMHSAHHHHHVYLYTGITQRWIHEPLGHYIRAVYAYKRCLDQSTPAQGPVSPTYRSPFATQSLGAHASWAACIRCIRIADRFALGFRSRVSHDKDPPEPSFAPMSFSALTDPSQPQPAGALSGMLPWGLSSPPLRPSSTSNVYTKVRRSGHAQGVHIIAP